MCAMDKNVAPSVFSALARRFTSVAIDLDGTALLPDSSFSERTLRAFASCARAGIDVLIVTGRSPTAALKFSSALGSDGPMVYYNGAAVVDSGTGKVLASTPVPTEVVAGCLAVARERDYHFQAFLAGDRLVCLKDTPEREAYFKRTGLLGAVEDFDGILGGREGGEPTFIKCMFIGEPDQLSVAEREVDARFGTRVYRTRTTRTFLEVMNNGVSKGNALKVALGLRGKDVSDCVAFGDAENDLKMLEAAGWSVAMGNADEALKRSADDIALPNTEDGVAAYLERLLALRS